ncbi:DUF6412 domain-containing protein [Agromyces salentinus]|uniref:Uncharacterized protein n=1 Tax=Agromyces salentinus TaxID=269421 RepID=A0ABN2MZ29_9MICO|nr:DUF6412 domain-containing protein [Agromyces salentinus]
MDHVVALLRLIQGVLEPQLAGDAHVSLLVIGALGIAAVAVVVIAHRAVPALVGADPTGASLRLRQTADPGRLISQSDPDAAGRPRPRAPGRGIPAA